jgi:hypothetical protein
MAGDSYRFAPTIADDTMSMCGFRTWLTVVLQDMVDGFGLRSSSGWSGAMTAGVGLEDGDVGIGSFCVGADLGAVDEDAKDGVLDGDSDRSSLMAVSYP